MNDERRLIFVPSSGLPPPPGTLAAALLYASSVDDEAVWDQLGIREMSETDLEDAVATLRGLGWGFYYASVQ